eukprot:g15098.t1
MASNTPSNKRILVTGTHRSGTTWMGKMLSANRSVAYIHEPFNVDEARFGLPIQHWFSYLPDVADPAAFDAAYRRLLKFQGPGMAGGGAAGKAKAFIKRLGFSMLIKDPLALMSADQLARDYGLQVVCMIRHPLAFCSSIKKWGWAFPFADFLAQPKLMADHFAEYRDDITRFANDEQPIVDQGILLWNLLHSVIKTYQDQHNEWLFIRHEDATQQPDEVFRDTYQRLGLAYTPAAQAAVAASSQSDRGETKDHQFKARDKDAVLKTWQDRLDADEIDQINAQTQVLRDHFYPEAS